MIGQSQSSTIVGLYSTNAEYSTRCPMEAENFKVWDGSWSSAYTVTISTFTTTTTTTTTTTNSTSTTNTTTTTTTTTSTTRPKVLVRLRVDGNAGGSVSSWFSAGDYFTLEVSGYGVAESHVIVLDVDTPCG